MNINDEMVEAGCKAHADEVYAGWAYSKKWPHQFSSSDQDKLRRCMRATLEAVAPMIRAEAFEEAAKVADGFVEAASKALADPATPDNMRAQYQARWAAGVDAASAIRAMVERG